MNGESGQSMELMEEVPFMSELERLVRMVDGDKPGVDSRDDGKYTGRNNL